MRTIQYLLRAHHVHVHSCAVLLHSVCWFLEPFTRFHSTHTTQNKTERQNMTAINVNNIPYLTYNLCICGCEVHLNSELHTCLLSVYVAVYIVHCSSSTIGLVVFWSLHKQSLHLYGSVLSARLMLPRVFRDWCAIYYYYAAEMQPGFIDMHNTVCECGIYQISYHNSHTH